MPVLNYQVNAPGYGGINPKLVYIFTDDPIAVVTATSYIDWMANPNGIYEGDVALIVTQETPTSTLGVAFYEFERIGTTNHWNLIPITNSPVTVTTVEGTLNQIIATPNVGDVVVSIYPNPQIPGIASIGLPHGTTAQRAGIIGSIRFNTDTGLFEGTPDGITWVAFASGSSGVSSVTGTANEINVSPTTGNSVVSISDNPIIPGTAEVTLPAGNTGARGNRPGSIRLNTTTGFIELTNDGVNWYTVLNTNNGVQSVTGTANRITVTGTTNAVIDIAATYIGQTSITTLGVITAGTWNASVITVPFGGTSASSFTVFAPICGGVTTTSILQSAAAGISNVGYVLTSTGAASLPTWQVAPGNGASQYIRVPLTANQFIGGAGPVQILPAPGAGLIYIVTAWAIEVGVANFTAGLGGTFLQLQNTSGFAPGNFACTGSISLNNTQAIAPGMYPVSPQARDQAAHTPIDGILANTPLYYGCTGALTAGIGASAALHIYYTVVATI
jgi:hypothetical protein